MKNKHIDCYFEYLTLEKFLRNILKILKFSFLPRRIFDKNGGKYIFHIYHIYFVISLTLSSFCFKKDIAEWCIVTSQIISILQILTKFFAILNHEEELNQLFQWIQQLHEMHQIDSIAESVRNHLGSTLVTVQRILK